MNASRPAVMLAVLGLLGAGPVKAEVDGGYVIVVSEATRADEGWGKVVEALGTKHGGEVVTFEKGVEEALPRLKEVFPRYACFVATPEEAGADFATRVHQMSRKLDDDPYADVRWGILTGYDAENALKIARCEKPLTVRKVAAGTEVALEMCEQGRWFDELRQKHMVVKKPGGEPEAAEAPADTTEALVETLNAYQPDLFVTSGHATEHDWQIGFAYRNGQFRCEDGTIFGLDTKGNRYPVDSPNPKVYLAVGNCLMGHINGRDVMALAWLKSAGVNQMVGYTDLTWFGYAGWGCLDYFVEQPGRYTLNEAFLANQHALIHLLETGGSADPDREGLLYDRDKVAFYGDPAWEARMAERPKAWEQVLIIAGDLYTFTIDPMRGSSTFLPINRNGSQRGGRPIVAFLPYRVADVELVEGEDLHPVITDDFILVPNPGPNAPDRPLRVVFRARRVEP